MRHGRMSHPRDPSARSHAPHAPSAPCDVRVEQHGAVAVLVLDDERRKNAMTPELGDALYDAVERGARSTPACALWC